MTSDWSTAEIGSFAKLRSGYSFKSADWKGEGTPVIKISNVKAGRIVVDGCGFVDEAVAACAKDWYTKPGDVLIAMTGYVGEVALVQLGERYLINQRVGRFEFVSDSPVDGAFFFYVLQEPEFRQRIEGLARGSAQPNLSSADAHKLKVPVPPLVVQQGIASTLASLDDRIALLRETNATLEAIAQALFKSWFVDFDPVRAKQQGLAPAGVDDSTAALFPDRFEESVSGLVPQGWQGGTLDDLADLNSQSWSGRHHPERVRYLDLANVKDNEVATVTEFAFDEAPSRARRVLRSGDTIVGTVRPGNRSFAFIHEPVPDLTASTGFAVLSPTVVDNTAFVYLSATQDASIDHLSHIADGGAYPAVRPDVVSALACVVPSAEILRAFNAVACPLLVKVSANQRQAQTLATLRDTLLPRLISGQLRLPDAEALPV